MNSYTRLRLITTLSAALEFFDFTLLIYLAPVLAANFFPESSGIGNIMPVLLLFFAGYLARFFGGLLFSHAGDRHGRKKYFQWSILLMSASTLGIAVVPDYDSWGIAATLILFILRLLQGLSLGGEVPGAVVFASEHCPDKKRGVVTGLIVCGVTSGNILASGFIWLLFETFGESAVYEWAWRLAFLTGCGLGFISFWLRRSLSETPVYLAMEKHQKQLPWPVKQLVHKYGYALIKGTFLAAVPAVFISVLLYMPYYQQNYLHTSFSGSYSINTLGFSLMVVLTLLLARLSDKTGRLPLMRTGSFLLIPTSLLYIYLLSSGYTEQVSWFIFILMITAMSFVMGIYEVAMVELFPTEARYSGVAFCHNLAFSLFGGLTPIVLEWFCRQGMLLAPGLMISLLALNLLILSWNWHDRYQLNLQKI